MKEIDTQIIAAGDLVEKVIGYDYCIYCARPDGSMQSYPEKLEGTAEFLVRTQGLDKDAARQTAIRLLSKLPAWKDMESNAE